VIVGMVLIDVVGVVAETPNPGEFNPKKLLVYFMSKGFERSHSIELKFSIFKGRIKKGKMIKGEKFSKMGRFGEGNLVVFWPEEGEIIKIVLLDFQDMRSADYLDRDCVSRGRGGDLERKKLITSLSLF